MPREARVDFPAELPEWRRSGPFLLIQCGRTRPHRPPHAAPGSAGKAQRL